MPDVVYLLYTYLGIMNLKNVLSISMADVGMRIPVPEIEFRRERK